MSIIDKIGIIRYLIIIIVTVTASLLVVDLRLRDPVVESCEKRLYIHRELIGFLEDASNNRTKLADESNDKQETITNNQAANIYNKRADRIRANLVTNCSNVFPPLIPLAGMEVGKVD